MQYNQKLSNATTKSPVPFLIAHYQKILIVRAIFSTGMALGHWHIINHLLRCVLHRENASCYSHETEMCLPKVIKCILAIFNP